MFNSPQLEGVAQEVEDTIVKITERGGQANLADLYMDRRGGQRGEVL